MKILTTLNATERGAMTAAIVAISSLLVSCANFVPPSGPKGGQNNPWIVTIKFQGISKCKIQSVTAENNTCGLSDPAEICVRQSKFLEWQSDPNGVGFNIYFDPIKGGPNYTAPNGKKKVHVDANAPPGFYKYSILGRDSSCDPDTDTVDPMIRVDK